MDFKEVLALTDMNMRQFAEYFNIPYKTVLKWGNGERKPPEYVLELLKFRIEAEASGFSLDVTKELL